MSAPAPPPNGHPTSEVLDRWAAAALASVAHPAGEATVAPVAGVDEATALAVERHLVGCAACRATADAAARARVPDRLEDGFWALAAELDAPRPGVVERVLRRCRVPGDVARLLVATPALRRAWFAAMAVALLFGVAAADPDRADPSELLFLVVAPLIPVVGVALAYGRGVDPAHEMTVATPMSGLRLVLVRAVAVLSVSLAATGVAALAVAEVGPRAAAWLVPSLALSAACLAATSWLAPRVAGAVTAGVWLAVVVVVNRAADDRFAAFGIVPQVAWAVLGAVAVAVVVARRRAFDLVGAGS